MDRAHLAYLLFALNGRIPRAAYWIGTLIIIGTSFAAFWIFGQLLGLTLDDFANQDPKVIWMSLGVTLVLLYPGLAVMIKRLHDRNRSGWWAVGLYTLSVAGDILDLTGFSGPAEQPSISFMMLWGFMAVLGIWFFIELGFLKGTTGDNRYGPDPLGGPADASLD